MTKRLFIIALASFASLMAIAKPTPPDTNREHFMSLVWNAITSQDTSAVGLLDDFQSRYGATSDYLTLQAMTYYAIGDEQSGRSKLDEAMQNVTKRDLFSRAVILLFIARRCDDPLDQLLYAGEAIKADPKFAKAYAFRARVYYETGFMMKEAERDIQKAIKLAPTEISYRSQLARIYIMEEKRDKAAKEIKNMLKMDENYADAFYLRAFLMRQEGNIEKYVDDYLIYLQITHDTDLETIEEVAQDGTAAHYDYLMDFAAKILDHSNRHEDIAYWNYFIGEMKSLNSDWSCIDNFRAGLDVVQDMDLKCRLMLAESNFYYEKDNYDSALVMIDQAIDIIEQEGVAAYWIYHSKAGYLKHLKRYAEADSTFSKSLTCIIPDSARRSVVYYARFDLRLHNLNDTAGALADIDSALAYTPDRCLALYNRGKLLKKLGRTDLANADFNRILEIDTLLVLNSYRHFAYAQMGRRDDAEAWHKQWYDLAESEVEVWYAAYNSACLFSILGDASKAVGYLMEVMAIEPVSCDLLTGEEDFDNIRNTPEFLSVQKVSCSDAND